MARIDSRSAGSSGILITSNSRNWGYIKQPNSYVLNDRWYHIELNFHNSKIQLKIDSDIIAEEDSKIQIAGSIGMFNELKRVFVNNVLISGN